MAGATVSTCQLELDITALAKFFHVVCISAGFQTIWSMSASIPECG